MVCNASPRAEKQLLSYLDLLRSYRIAHARVQAIDAFETALKENTPLTTIGDPKSLVEYINQTNLKGDLVLDELKRVSNERDSFKQRLDEAEKQTREAYDEAAKLRMDKPADQSSASIDEERRSTSSRNDTDKRELGERDPLGATRKSPPPPLKSPSISIPKMSLFSPRTKPVTSPRSQQGSEDLFSYDEEIPRLENEIRSRQASIAELEGDVQKLKRDLAVTRESTQSMVQTLEEATREANLLRDSKERSEADAREQKDAYLTTISKLREDLKRAEEKLQNFESTANSSDSDRIQELSEQLKTAQSEIEVLRTSNSELGAKVEGMDKLNKIISHLEEQLNKAEKKFEAGEKQRQEYQSSLDNMRLRIQEVEAKNVELTSQEIAPNPSTEAKEPAVSKFLGIYLPFRLFLP